MVVLIVEGSDDGREAWTSKAAALEFSMTGGKVDTSVNFSEYVFGMMG